MHLDLAKDAPAELAGEIAIVGAGAAGITLARRLLAHGRSVILLESGGRDYDPRTADLAAGENIGLPYYDLEDARLRFFGGTTAIWGGRCSELDPIDLERRPWVPHSGWPIGWDELAGYYAEARPLFGLQAGDPLAPPIPPPAFDAAELVTPVWRFDRQFDRFSFARAADLLRHPRCTILTHATVTAIEPAADGNAIAALEARSLTGRRTRIAARQVVLAAGGIETPRLMLASDIGNRHDQVGRYFMEHPHARGGRIVDGDAWGLFAAFARQRIAGGGELAALIAAAPALQRREGLLNTSLTIAPRRPPTARESWGMRAYLKAKHSAAPDRLGRTLWLGVKSAAGWAQRRTDPMRPWLLHRLGRLDVALVVRAEQAPNPASRVTLGGERDELGMPRVRLDWRTSALDVDSVAGLVAALGREATRLGLGRVEPAPWLSDPAKAWITDPLISAHPIGGYHHIGTTRMSDDPKTGVTDGWGRVHGLANLHVAGSSLFPTSGWANPTLTIVALALRTADRLHRVMDR
ncbi:MAG: GMC family oxidoreductase [Sphingomonas fennica]